MEEGVGKERTVVTVPVTVLIELVAVVIVVDEVGELDPLDEPEGGTTTVEVWPLLGL